MNSIEIRIGIVEDASLLSRIGEETFRDTYGDDPHFSETEITSYVGRAYDEDSIRRELIDEGFRYLIAETDESTAGFARLKIGSTISNVDAAYPLEISRIYLKPGFQGSGNGRALMERCLEEAERFMCDAVWLSVWNKNEKAIGFYEKMGFDKAGTCEFDMAGTIQTDFVMVLYRDENLRRPRVG